MSPKKMPGHHKIYVTPLEKKDAVPESPSSVTYSLFKSSPKELHKIKCIVNGITTPNTTTTQLTVTKSDIKRTLPFDEPPIPAIKVRRVENTQRITTIDRKLTSLITERQDNRDDESRN